MEGAASRSSSTIVNGAERVEQLGIPSHTVVQKVWTGRERSFLPLTRPSRGDEPAQLNEPTLQNKNTWNTWHSMTVACWRRSRGTKWEMTAFKKGHWNSLNSLWRSMLVFSLFSLVTVVWDIVGTFKFRRLASFFLFCSSSSSKLNSALFPFAPLGW